MIKSHTQFLPNGAVSGKTEHIIRKEFNFMNFSASGQSGVDRFTSLAPAQKAFEKKFLDKTKNHFHSRANFVPVAVGRSALRDSYFDSS